MYQISLNTKKEKKKKQNNCIIQGLSHYLFVACVRSIFGVYDTKIAKQNFAVYDISHCHYSYCNMHVVLTQIFGFGCHGLGICSDNIVMMNLGTFTFEFILW